MPDREKVIKGLECCVSGNTAICERLGCPYADEHEGISDTCIDTLMADALALLKAQEAVEPTWRRGKAFCGKCGLGLHKVVEQNNYCPNCGRAVKWE